MNIANSLNTSTAAAATGSLATTISIPWSWWDFYTTDNSGILWCCTDGINGAPFAAIAQNLGTRSIIIPYSGNYRCSIVYQAQSDRGILHIDIGGVTQDIDMYDASSHIQFFTFNMDLVAGPQDITMSILTKNPSSSGFFSSFIVDFRLSYLPIGP